MPRSSRIRSTSLAFFLALVSGSSMGCEAIQKVRGAASLIKEIDEHLEEDLKAPLTDEKIDMLVRVLPDLNEYSESLSEKWKPDPKVHDLRKAMASLGALVDYVSFFESEDTRLTEFYVVFIKVMDARAAVAIDEGTTDIQKKLDEEKVELEKAKASASGDELAKLEKRLVQNQKSREKMDAMIAEGEKAQQAADIAKEAKPYDLTDEEIALVQARKADIDAALKAGGYGDQVAEEEKNER